MSARQKLERRLLELEDQLSRCGYFQTEEAAAAAHQERDRIDQQLAGLPAEPAPIREVQVAELRLAPGQDISWKSITLGRVVSFFELEQLNPSEAALLHSELAGGMATRGRALDRTTRADERERLEAERTTLAAMINRLKFAKSGELTPGERKQLEELKIALEKSKEERQRLRRLVDLGQLNQQRRSLEGQLRSVHGLIQDFHAVADERTLESLFIEVAYDALPPEQFAKLMGTAARGFSRRRLERLADFGAVVDQLTPHLQTVVAITNRAEQLVDQPSPAPA